MGENFLRKSNPSIKKKKNHTHTHTAALTEIFVRYASYLNQIRLLLETVTLLKGQRCGILSLSLKNMIDVSFTTSRPRFRSLYVSSVLELF